MLYLAITFWLLMVVLVADGVHTMWSALLRPRVVNSLLLPGTLVATLGHVLGCLVTGATIERTKLITEDGEGKPETTREPRPQIPVVGPIIIAMLPFLACSAALAYVLGVYGPQVIGRMQEAIPAIAVPTSLAGLWQMLRDLITLMEATVNAVTAENIWRWQSWLFIYVVVCLTVRMAPLPGKLRSSVGAIVAIGILSALIGTSFPVTQGLLRQSWTMLCFAVAVLLFLLLVSALLRGLVALIDILRAAEA